MPKCPIKGPHDCNYSFEEHAVDCTHIIEGIKDHHNTRRDDSDVMKLDGLKQVQNDMLHDIIEKQHQFMNMLGVPALDLQGRDRKLPVTDFIKMFTSFSQTCTTAINCETTELLDALPWKPWKKSYKEVDLDNVHLEIIDILHFVLELAIIWGLDAKAIHEIYMKKMQENIDRQKKGY